MSSVLDEISPEVAYSLATGKAFAPFGDIHKAAENLIGRSIWTHEFAELGLWEVLRNRFEEAATEKYNEWQKENSS